MEKLYCEQIFDFNLIGDTEGIISLESGDITITWETTNILKILNKIHLGDVYVFDTIEKDNKIICRGIYSIKEIID